MEHDIPPGSRFFERYRRALEEAMLRERKLAVLAERERRRALFEARGLRLVVIRARESG